MNMQFDRSQPSQAVDFAADPEIAERALTERRKLGAFYTPERLSNVLAAWAVQRATDTILEPSFGGCGFLASACLALGKAGSAVPIDQIYGCDVDRTAFSYLRREFGSLSDLSGFLLKDFLDCGREPTWPTSFDAVLANPPYIPHHRIGRDRVKELSGREWPVRDMSGRSSLWAYFLVHAVTMLRPGGRMAWVLPGAFLQADYAKPIKSFLAENFERVACFVVRDRLFLSEGTDEETVVLLADSFKARPLRGAMELGAAETLGELENLISEWSNGTWSGDASGSAPASLRMSRKALSSFRQLDKIECAVSFGSLAKVQIGIVTGANDFFVLRRADVEDAGLEKGQYERVLSKFRAAPGLSLIGKDLDAYEEQGGKSFLINTDDPDQNTPLGAYLSTFDKEKRASTSTFKKRAVWSATSDGKTPDAFFPVMHHTGPRLVLNSMRCTSTNTIHRVYFIACKTERRKLAAISMLTSFSQVSAELIGRRYGSGVLKHEPRDAEKIRILMPAVSKDEINTATSEIDSLLRAGDSEGAMKTADLFIYRAIGIGKPDAVSTALRESLQVIREKRRPPKASTPPSVAPHLA